MPRHYEGAAGIFYCLMTKFTSCRTRYHDCRAAAGFVIRDDFPGCQRLAQDTFLLLKGWLKTIFADGHCWTRYFADKALSLPYIGHEGRRRRFWASKVEMRRLYWPIPPYRRIIASAIVLSR